MDETREVVCTLEESTSVVDATVSGSSASTIVVEQTEGEQITLTSSTVVINVDSRDWYDGEYSFTPSSTAQTISTSGKTLSSNITINPIPSNYGRISWNGSTLTVS